MSLVVRSMCCAAVLAVSSTVHAEPTRAPTADAKPAPVRVYMRSANEPLNFAARALNSSGAPNLCTTPCDARLLPGKYELKLNGVIVGQSLAVQQPGTWHGDLHSHAGGRAGAWLGLNVGGILGGVLITVAALGGPSWAYIAGGGSLAAGGLVFVVAYRADQASVSFSPGEPPDVRGMPPQQGASAVGSTPDRAPRAAQARGFGFRLDF